MARYRGIRLETTMDTFLLQAIVESTDARLAFSNGWCYGAPLIPGEVTMNDIDNIIPMNPPIAIVELTGKTQKYGRNRHAHTQRGIETLRAFMARDRPLQYKNRIK